MHIKLDELMLGGSDETNCGTAGRLASAGIWMLYARGCDVDIGIC